MNIRFLYTTFILICISSIHITAQTNGLESIVSKKNEEEVKNAGALKRANKAFDQASYADAITEYELFLKRNPTHANALRHVGISYTLINHYADAEKHFATLVNTPSVTDLDKLHYAQILLVNQKSEEAKVWCEKYLTTNPTDEAANMLLSSINHKTLYYKDTANIKVTRLAMNTINPEFCPIVFKNELLFVSSQKTSPLINREHAWTNNSFYNIYASKRKDSLTFDKPTRYIPYLSTKFNNGPVSVNAIGKELFYSQNGKKPKKGDKTIRLRIFSVEGDGQGNWSDQIKPFVYNDDSYSCMHPCISSESKRLYFTSDMKGSIGGTDIWYCESEGNGVWGKPKNAGEGVNTKGNESFPFITGDDILYFSSDSRDGLGGLDIYRSEKNGNVFSVAENMGAPMNSMDDDFGVSFYNSKSGYFSSNRLHKNLDDDIYYVWNNKPIKQLLKITVKDTLQNDLLPTVLKIVQSGLSDTITLQNDSGKFQTKLLPDNNYFIVANCGNKYVQKTTAMTVSKETLATEIIVNKKSDNCVYGLVIDKDTQLPVKGLLLNIDDEDGNKIYETTTDSTGRYKKCQLLADKKYYIGTIKKPDYFSQTADFTMNAHTDLEKNVYVQRIVVGKGIKIENIYFDLGKWNIKQESSIELDKIVKLMKENSDIIIELGSHTDCRGKKSANFALSDKRAKSSAAYIISKGIAKNRVKGKGYGESVLVNNCGCEGTIKSDCSEDFHAVNRRTEFKVIGFLKEKK